MVNELERFRAITESTAAVAGISVDTSNMAILTRPHTMPDERTMAAVPSTNGLQYMIVTENIYGTQGLPVAAINPESAIFGLNGMLVETNVKVRITDLPDNLQISPDDRPVIYADIVPSPLAVNGVQKALGRRPGQDAFTVVGVTGAGQFTNGSWIYGFANKEIWTADLSEPLYCNHDLKPDDHIQGWIGTPPKFVDVIANRAADLIRDNEGKIPDHKYADPDHIGNFLYAADYLSIYTDILFNGLVGAHRADDTPRQAAAIIVPTMAAFGRDEGHGIIIKRPNLKPHQLFSNLGFMSPDTNITDPRVAVINQQFILHIAGLLIKAEELHPRENTEQSKQKVELWHAIIKEAAK